MSLTLFVCAVAALAAPALSQTTSKSHTTPTSHHTCQLVRDEVVSEQCYNIVGLAKIYLLINLVYNTNELAVESSTGVSAQQQNKYNVIYLFYFGSLTLFRINLKLCYLLVSNYANVIGQGLSDTHTTV